MPTLEQLQCALLAALRQPASQDPHQHLPEVLMNLIASCALPISARGLNCYQSNAHAMAERALSAAYPVVTAVLSADSMAQLARALWHTHPPTCGDLALWGDALPSFMAHSPQLAELPWLPDLARVEWALHRAHAAPDVPTDLSTLQLLTTHDPDHLSLRLAAGTQVLHSRFAVVPTLAAHRLPSGPEQDHAIATLGEAGEQWCPAEPEHALVWRVGVQAPELCAITQAEAGFLNALQSGTALMPALDQCPALDFSTWLPQAVRQGVVTGVLALE